jgi:four helix bundle protein
MKTLRCSSLPLSLPCGLWRKRRYSAAFVSKLSDAETEATETQVWMQFAVACKYLSSEVGDEIRQGYDHVIGKLVKMINHPEDWVLRSRKV